MSPRRKERDYPVLEIPDAGFDSVAGRREAMLRLAEKEKYEEILKDMGIEPRRPRQEQSGFPTPQQAKEVRRAGVARGDFLDRWSVALVWDLLQVLKGNYTGVAADGHGVYRFMVNRGYVDSVAYNVDDSRLGEVQAFMRTRGWEVKVDDTANGDAADYYWYMSIGPVSEIVE